MLSASDHFLQRADAMMRPISWSLFISFARELIADADFFTVGVSTVGGSDIIKGEDTVLQQWDKYQYDEYTNRVVTMEWQQSMDPVYSVQSALGDIVLDNHDNYLSADNYARPQRPLRIGAGFGNQLTGDVEILPQFVGLIDQAPVIDEPSKTLSYHVVDFLSSLYDKPLTAVVMLQNVSTDQVLDALLQLVGLSPTQYDLDVGFNIIPFVYFDTTMTFGDACQQLMQAEMGRLYMSETGRITFKNRQNFSDEPVWYFDRHNVLDYQTSQQSDIINVVEITANVREVQTNQLYWQSSTATLVPAGGTAQVIASFSDPVVSVDVPVEYGSSATSNWTANTASDDSGDDVTAGVSVDTTEFATSYLMTFTNTNSFDVYLTAIQLYAAPAPAVRTVTVREQDDDSVDQNDEQLLQIENDFFIDEATATSKALIILADNANFSQLAQLTVRGNPALQINDAITVAVRHKTYVSVASDTLASVATAYSTTLAALEALNPTLPTSGDLTEGTKVQLGIVPETVAILGIQRQLNTPQFVQVLTVKPLARVKYFTVGISTVGSTDAIAP